jgi:hypothetical protein
MTWTGTTLPFYKFLAAKLLTLKGARQSFFKDFLKHHLEKIPQIK